MTAIAVPVNGGQGTPTATPAAPVLVPPSTNQTPPPPPPLTGNPIMGPGQAPGWVQPPQQPAQPAPAPGTQDIAGIVQLLQAALAGPAPAQPAPQQPAPAQQVDAKPTWMQGSVREFDVSSIDDPIIKSMATVLQVSGKDLDLDRVLGKALAFGDPALVDTAYLFEAGGPQAAQLAEIAKGIVTSVNAKADAVTRSVYESVGGEAAWVSSVTAFNQAAPHELRVTVAQMLDSTNEQFIKAGARIVAEFGKTSGLLPQANPLVNTAPALQNSQGLSKENFQAELRKLNHDAPTYYTEREALFARRSLGKRIGL